MLAMQGVSYKVKKHNILFHLYERPLVLLTVLQFDKLSDQPKRQSQMVLIELLAEFADSINQFGRVLVDVFVVQSTVKYHCCSYNNELRAA